jgi:hypothetical protein
MERQSSRLSHINSCLERRNIRLLAHSVTMMPAKRPVMSMLLDLAGVPEPPMRVETLDGILSSTAGHGWD